MQHSTMKTHQKVECEGADTHEPTPRDGVNVPSPGLGTCCIRSIHSSKEHSHKYHESSVVVYVDIIDCTELLLQAHVPKMLTWKRQSRMQ